jgi:peptide/nickel transport system permease protein
MMRKRDKLDQLAISGSLTPWQEIRYAISKDNRAIIGLVFIGMLFFVAIFADVIAPFGMREQNLQNVLQSPTLQHWLGTDDLGRDVLSRIIYGTRTSLVIGVSSVSIALAIGGVLGLVSGYFKGIIDILIMRFSDVLLSIPSILLAIAIVASFGSGLFNMIVAIAIGNIAIFARIIRSSVMTISERQFIEASHALGSSHVRILLKHILPNVLSPIIVQSSLGIAFAILAAAGLGFIGLGLEASVAEWGLMLSNGRAYIRTQTYLTIYPGLAIMLTILAFNMLGDGIRDAFDPKMRDR